MPAEQKGPTPLSISSHEAPGISPASSPLYVQVKKHLIHRVLSGEWKPGERLPSETELAAGYGLSQGTVRKAIVEMVSEGLVARWPGRGTFVSSHGPNGHRPFRFNSIHMDDGRRMAGQPTRYVECRQGGAGERAALGLGIASDDLVSIAVRVRLLDDEPVLVETSYLPESRCPGVHEILRQQEPNSIYQVLEQNYGILVTRVEERVRARIATESEASLLEIPAGTAILEIERTAFSLGDDRVEWRTMVCETSDSHYITQRNR